LTNSKCAFTPSLNVENRPHGVIANLTGKGMNQNEKLLEVTATIVAAYCSASYLPLGKVQDLIAEVHDAFLAITKEDKNEATLSQ